MDERVAGALRLLPDYLGQHVLLSASSLLLGLAVSAPLVVLARNSARVRWPVLTFVSVIRTVPSLALLALFYPLLLALSSLSLEAVRAWSYAALGFLPSLLALTLYSMLPIVRNGVTALLNIDPAVMEAARGVGMTPRQSLLRVELPLAMPVIMAGIRTSAVWVIGTATLSTPVGQTSLGNYIFSGLQIENWVSVLFGCLSAVALAVIADQLLALVENGVATRRPLRVAWAGVARCRCRCGDSATTHGAKSAYVVGAKSFSEQYILADLMADRIVRAGSSATQRIGLGSVIAFKALSSTMRSTSYVDYSGHRLGKRSESQGFAAAGADARRDDAPAEGEVRGDVARIARIRERLCAGDAGRSGAVVERALDRRILPGMLVSCGSGPTSSFWRGRSGRRCATVMASRFGRSGSISRPSCIARSRVVKWM